MKLRELLNYRDRSIRLETGDVLLSYAVKSLPGAREFATVYSALRLAGLDHVEAEHTALVAAEAVVEQNITQKPPAKPETFKQALRNTYDKLEATLGGTAVTDQKFAPAPKPTFEESLDAHQRQCLACRAEALTRWNKKVAQ